MTIFSHTETWKLTDEQLTSAVVEAFGEKARIEARCAALVAAAEDRNLPRLSGTTSTGTWISNLTKVSVYEAARTVRRSDVMSPDVEQTRACWEAGDINGDQAEVIDPLGAEEHIGRRLEEEEKRARQHTSLVMQRTTDGLTRIKAHLPHVQAGILRAALEGIASPRRNSRAIYDRDGDHSDAAVGPLTHDQKLGRAFCELLEHLPSDAMPQHGGLASTMTINIDLDALKDKIGKGTLSTGDEMSASQARRFACNANLIPSFSTATPASSTSTPADVSTTAINAWPCVTIGRAQPGSRAAAPGEVQQRTVSTWWDSNSPAAGPNLSGMDAAELRDYCLSMPGAFEDFPFGPDASVFKVRALVEGARHRFKMFALSDLHADPLTISLKCEPSLAITLRDDHEEITTAYHFNKTHWNGVRLDGALPDQMVRELIEDSYDLVVSTLNKDQKALLGWSRG